jgi:hypothetical protein
MLIRVSNGKVIGSVKDRVFRKSGFHSSKHLCRRHNAIGIDREAFFAIFEEIRGKGIIRVRDLDTGLVYESTASNFFHNRIEDDLGSGPQYFLPLNLWNVKQQGQQPLALEQAV